MQIKTFRGASLQEALQRVRQELGPEASVLQTREIKSKRVFGRAPESIIEVQASLDAEPEASEDRIPGATSPALAPAPPEAHTATADWFAGLVACGHAEPTARALLEKSLPEGQTTEQPAIHDNGARQRWLEDVRHEMARNLNCCGPLQLNSQQCQLHVFVGPPGTGKTTAIGKLATQLRSAAACELGLLTIDTRRPGAVDQLLDQADRLEAMLEVVSSPAQVPAAIERLKACDVVLMDTAGCSPQDTGRLREMESLLTAARPQATHLVLDAATSQANARHAIQQFRRTQITDLIVAKVDQAIDFGSWYALLVDCELPLSYLSYGQLAGTNWSAPTESELAQALTPLGELERDGGLTAAPSAN